MSDFGATCLAPHPKHLTCPDTCLPPKAIFRRYLDPLACPKPTFLPYWLWVKTVLGSHFGVGEFTSHFRTYVSGDWDVHWRGTIWILTHGHISSFCFWPVLQTPSFGLFLFSSLGIRSSPLECECQTRPPRFCATPPSLPRFHGRQGAPSMMGVRVSALAGDDGVFAHHYYHVSDEPQTMVVGQRFAFLLIWG